MEALSGVKGDNSLKIFGPDLDQLELLAEKAKNILQGVQGIANVGIFHVRGSSHLQFRVDPEKCQKWGVMTADVNNVVSSAVGAKAMSSMVEGEKLFDISTRWPKWRRSERDVDPGHPGGHHQQPGGPGAGLGLHAQRQRACLAAARGRRQPGRHVQPDQQHPANPARRPGHAGGRGPRRRTPTAGSIAPAPRPSTARTASA